MNRFPPTDPMGYVIRRLSSVPAVAGAILGIAVAGFLEGVGLPILVAVAIGLVPFLVVAMFSASVTARDTGAPPAPASVNANTDIPSAASETLREWGQASQLGPDHEQ